MREIVPDGQGRFLAVFYLVGNSVFLALGSRASQDVWLAFLLAVVMALPLVVIYARMRVLLHREPLGPGLERLVGKWPARLAALLYTAYAWRLAGLVCSDMSNFIQAISLPTTPEVVLAACFALLALWGAKLGVEALARWASVMGKIVFTVLFGTLILLMTDTDFNQFLPIMYHGFQPVLHGALQLLDFPFLETVLLFWLFDCFQNKNSPYKVFIPGFLIAALGLFIISGATFAVLGAESYHPNYYFPLYSAVARIDVAAFLTRLEAIVGMTLATGSFLKITVCLLAASKALSIALGFADYRFLVTPLALGLIPASQYFITTMMEIEANATKVYSPFVVLVHVVIPVFFWLLAEVRTRMGKGAKRAGQA